MKGELVPLPFKVDVKKIDVFPNERQRVVADFFKAFDDYHVKAIQAKAITLNPFQCFKNHLEITFNPSAAAKASLVPAGVLNLPVIKTVAISEWFSSNVHSEQAASKGDEVSSHGLADIELKNLISKVNAHFQDVAVHCQTRLATQGSNLVLVSISNNKQEDSKDSKDKDPKDKKDQKEKKGDQDLQRIELKDHIGEVIKPSPCHLPYWGKVVDEVSARKLNKASLMPLYPVTPHSPMLYLSGSEHSSLGRSDSCLAWHFKTIAVQKPRDTSKDPSTEEMAENEFKKRKFDMQEAERQSKLPVVTHHVQFKEHHFDCINAQGTIVSHTYNAPFITDFPDGDKVFKKRCFRKVMDWDKDESLKKVKTEKLSKTFTMM